MWMSEWLLSVIYTMLQKINIISNIFRQKKIILKKIENGQTWIPWKGSFHCSHMYSIYIRPLDVAFEDPFFLTVFFLFLIAKWGSNMMSLPFILSACEKWSTSWQQRVAHTHFCYWRKSDWLDHKGLYSEQTWKLSLDCCLCYSVSLMVSY